MSSSGCFGVFILVVAIIVTVSWGISTSNSQAGYNRYIANTQASATAETIANNTTPKAVANNEEGTPIPVYLHRKDRTNLSPIMVFNVDSPRTANYLLTIGSAQPEPNSTQNVNVSINDGPATTVFIPMACPHDNSDPDWQDYSGVYYCSSTTVQLHQGDNTIKLSSDTGWDQYLCISSAYCPDIQGIELDLAN